MIDAVEAILDGGSNYLHMMYTAYLRETNVRADEVCLIEIKTPDETIYYFQRLDEVEILTED